MMQGGLLDIHRRVCFLVTVQGLFLPADFAVELFVVNTEVEEVAQGIGDFKARSIER